jgi:hypothetical protein
MRLDLGEQVEQVGCAGAEAGRGVREQHDAVAGREVHAQHREEARHRSAVAGEPPSLGVPHLPPEPLRAGPCEVRDVHDRHRAQHLVERLGPEHAGRVAGEERGPSGEVGDGRPQLAGRCQRDRIVLGLGLKDVGERVHREASRRRWLRSQGGAVHAERVEDARRDGLVPRLPAQARDQLTQSGESDVGVVEPGAGSEAQPWSGGDEVVPWLARSAFPPRSVGLGLQAGRVGEQLGDGDLPEVHLGQVRADRVADLESSFVTQPHDLDGHERLADRAEAVLRPRVGDWATGPAVERAACIEPGELAVAHDAGHQ